MDTGTLALFLYQKVTTVTYARYPKGRWECRHTKDWKVVSTSSAYNNEFVCVCLVNGFADCII